ncbi:hypothetical protein E3O11_00590 [Cryobacterium levicorallinum]|uniref:Cation-transporting ATPase n=1 Tax=Cryobacterium levicorallinum TaxID=995038 RepID=A0A1I2ZL79_9MICO|nr:MULTISPECIES: hypothetical protein [Cryobacterium]TFB89540.1 hypothetical protein E3O11_00590 [Cryobacterium levicorallinum]GEP25879.1 hypothetical protein CLE01_04770 [Cryobacterium levicorallinum]SFH38484.1 hypothetical protein SAMN05216274_104125 [Cryobacterium levicorallinum]
MSNFQRILSMAAKALDQKGQPSSGGSGKTDWRAMVRTAADKVTGDSRPPANNEQRSAAPLAGSNVSAQDRAAIARYDYLLQTAQPQQLEQVHRDAFARLTPTQRDEVNSQLRAELPTNEYPASSSPDDLARSATRGEAQNPGFLKKLFAKPSGRGVGGALAGAAVGLGAGGLLAAVAGGAVLSTVAGPLLEQAAGFGVDFENLAGGLEGVTQGVDVESLTGGLEGVTQGVADSAGEYATGLGEQVKDLGSNFEIPGLSALGNLFGRD